MIDHILARLLWRLPTPLYRHWVRLTGLAVWCDRDGCWLAPPPAMGRGEEG